MYEFVPYCFLRYMDFFEKIFKKFPVHATPHDSFRYYRMKGPFNQTEEG